MARGGHHTTDKLEEYLVGWEREHGTEYPPLSVCSHVRYRIWYRNRKMKKSFKWGHPKGGLNPPCLADDYKVTNEYFFKKTGVRNIPTY